MYTSVVLGEEGDGEARTDRASKVAAHSLLVDIGPLARNLATGYSLTRKADKKTTHCRILRSFWHIVQYLPAAGA